MAATVDARGLSCPQPVLMTVNEINSGNEKEIIVLVDTEASMENVSRAAGGKGCTVKEVVPEKDGFKILIERG